MPLTDLGETPTRTEAGVAWFAEDAETKERVMISVPAVVIALYGASDPRPDSDEFRAFIVGQASRLYDASPKLGYVIVDMEALDLPA